AGEDAEHARHRLRRSRVDGFDAPMRDARAQDVRVRLVGQADVVGVTALPAQESVIFLADQGLTDAELSRAAGALNIHGVPMTGRCKRDGRASSPAISANT